MTTGYSGKPLWDKLGLREGQRALVVNATGDAVPEYWHEAPFEVNLLDGPEPQLDFLHLFVANREQLDAHRTKLTPLLAKNGLWWISWPKKASKRGSDVTEDTLREVFLPLGLVDVKVASVTDELWSGLKLVWRKELR